MRAHHVSAASAAIEEINAVLTPILSNAISASTGALPARRRNASRTRHVCLARAPPPVAAGAEVLIAHGAHLGVFAEPGDQGDRSAASAPGHRRSRRRRHWQPASASAGLGGQFLRRNGVGHHQTRRFRAQFAEPARNAGFASASVRWLAIRQIDPPRASLMSWCLPGNIKNAIRAPFAVAAAS